MKLLRTFIVVLALPATAAHAQLNQFLGAVQSVQSAITQGKQLLPQIPAGGATQDPQQLMNEREKEAKEYSDRQAAAAQARGEAEIQQEKEAARKANAQMDAQDQAAIQASIRRDADKQQQAVAEARKIAALCPDLIDTKYSVAEGMIRCRNKGMTEAQEMTMVPATPLVTQPYVAAMIQDIYEDKITDPRKGKAIQDYYDRCLRQGTPCARPQW
jgi:flagellar motor protein MotB